MGRRSTALALSEVPAALAVRQHRPGSRSLASLDGTLWLVYSCLYHAILRRGRGRGPMRWLGVSFPWPNHA